MYYSGLPLTNKNVYESLITMESCMNEEEHCSDLKLRRATCDLSNQDPVRFFRAARWIGRHMGRLIMYRKGCAEAKVLCGVDPEENTQWLKRFREIKDELYDFESNREKRARFE